MVEQIEVTVAEDNKVAVRRFIETVFEQADLSALEDYVALSALRGILRNDVPQMHQSLSDIRCPVGRLLAEGDQVAVEFSLEGVPHEGPCAGSRISVLNMAIFQMKDRKIVAASVLADRVALFQQLGVSDVPPAAACPIE